jgi:hypothetical protein
MINIYADGQEGSETRTQSRWRGTKTPACFIEIGNMLPKKKLTSDPAMAFPSRDGMNQRRAAGIDIPVHKTNDDREAT